MWEYVPICPSPSQNGLLQVSLELLRSVLSKESALSDPDCVDRLLGMIAPILRETPNGAREDVDAAMQVPKATKRTCVHVYCTMSRSKENPWKCAYKWRIDSLV